LFQEKSSLREVIVAAEVIEIAHSVGGNNNKCTGEKGRQSGSGGATAGFSMSDGRHSKDDSRSNKGTNAASHGQSGDNKRQFRASQKGKHREGGNAKAGKEPMKKLKLLKEDHDHAVANKLCFGCKKPGHFANDCPDSKTVAGGSGNKPPGKVSSYSVQIATDIETLRELADTTETIDHLELGSCELMIESFMIDKPDYRRQRMGDSLMRRVEHVLTMSAPYPGDNTMDLGIYR
jgi:hypothetical protein